MGHGQFDAAAFVRAGKDGFATAQALKRPVADALATPHEAGFAVFVDQHAVQGRTGNDALQRELVQCAGWRRLGGSS